MTTSGNRSENSAGVRATRRCSCVASMHFGSYAGHKSDRKEALPIIREGHGIPN